MYISDEDGINIYLHSFRNNCGALYTVNAYTFCFVTFRIPLLYALRTYLLFPFSPGSDSTKKKKKKSKNSNLAFWNFKSIRESGILLAMKLTNATRKKN